MQISAKFASMSRFTGLGRGMNLADGIILLIVVVSAAIGLWRGFVREAFSLATWVAAFVIASLFTPGMDSLLAAYVHTPSVRLMTAFGILFILTLVVGSLLGHLLSELIRVTGLTGTDRLLGGLFGLLRGAILVVVLVALGQRLFQHDAWWVHSWLIPKCLGLQHWLWTVSDQLFGVLMRLSGRA